MVGPLDLGRVLQVGLVGEISDALLDCLIKHGLEGIPMLYRISVTFGLELEDGFEAVALMF